MKECGIHKSKFYEFPPIHVSFLLFLDTIVLYWHLPKMAAHDKTAPFDEQEEEQHLLIEQAVKDSAASYWNLLLTHRQYRIFLSSYTVSKCGEWLNYVASMAVLEQGHATSSSSSQNRHFLRISLLIVVRLLPNVMVAPLGGVLADTRDLRQCLIRLDLAGAVVAFLFWVAFLLHSPLLIYVATFLQQCLAGLYDPCRNAIIPQLVTDPNYLHKATTLSGLAWSTMAAIGSSLGGVLVATLGISTCFCLDSLSYVISAWLLWQIQGSYNAAALKNTSAITASWWSRIVDMSLEGFRYIRKSPYGAIVLIKGSSAIMYGASDVINVALSEVDDELHSERLGLLFACVGVGAFLGPMVTDPWVNMGRLITLQRLCVASFGITAIGYVGIGASTTFPYTCLWTIVRASGMSISWTDSSLMIQVRLLCGVTRFSVTCTLCSPHCTRN
jgi:hypothetical protein